jgi:hypothetical protein
MWSLLTLTARASPVLVQNDQKKGGGWLYSDESGCYVVTAKHVVFPDGTFHPPLLTTASGTQGQGVEGTLPPTDIAVNGDVPDVARVGVEGPLKSDCSDNLGYEHLDDTLSRITAAQVRLYLDRVGLAASERMIPVEVITLNKDRIRFAIRIVDSDLQVEEGDSGFPIRLPSDNILESGLPVGMLYQAIGTNKAEILRFDIIRRLFLKPAVLSNVERMDRALKRPELIAWSASMPDPGCGPINVFDSNPRCGWRPKPVRESQTVDLDLRIASVPTAISAISITLEPRSSITGFEVLITNGDPRNSGTAWESTRYCSAKPRSLTHTCSFLERSTLFCRVRIVGLRGGIRRLEWR